MSAVAAAAESGTATVELIRTIGIVLAAAISTVGAVYGVRAHNEARKAKVEARGAHTNAAAANHAVNNVPVGAPTLVQRVTDIEVGLAGLRVQTDWQSESVDAIAKQIGVKLPPAPPGG